MAVPLRLSKHRVSGNGHAAVQVAAVVVALLVVAAVLALGTPSMQGAAVESQPPAAHAGVTSYEAATREMIRINHLLEARQAELALAAGSSGRSRAVLRAQVASLERQYVAAIAAVTRAR
jgi:hypothetical protein